MKPLKYAPLLLFSFLLFACEKTDNGVSSANATQQFSTYPFGVGRQWKYKTVATINLPNDSAVYTYIMTYLHLADTTINGEVCHKVRTSNVDVNSTGIPNYGYYYYCDRSDGLYIVASHGNAGGFTFFREAQGSHVNPFKLMIPGLAIFNTDSVSLMDSAQHLTQLPIVYGQEWRSFEYGPAFNYKRKWLNGGASVTVPVGTFTCEKLQFLLNEAGSANIHAYQYYSVKGLTVVDYQQDSLITSGGGVGNSIIHSELIDVNF